MLPSLLTPYSDEIGPLLVHLCLEKFPKHLYLRDKDDSNSVQPVQYVRLKQQLMVRALSPHDDGFCTHINLQPCPLKFSTEK